MSAQLPVEVYTQLLPLSVPQQLELLDSLPPSQLDVRQAAATAAAATVPAATATAAAPSPPPGPADGTAAAVEREGGTDVSPASVRLR